MNWLRWLFGMNVRKPGSVIYVDPQGIGFTLGGLMALNKTLKNRNLDLENQVDRLTRSILSFQKEIYRREQLIRAYEETAWKPPTPEASAKWWKHEVFKRIDVKNA